MASNFAISKIASEIPVESRILVLRRKRVMIDADLAALYGITTKRLNEQIKRNKERFPPDFMFQISADEKRDLVANCDHLSGLKFSRGNPYAFTEHGAIMAASVLNTARAVDVSVLIVRTFVKLRQTLVFHKEFSSRLAELEHKVEDHGGAIVDLVATLRKLMENPQAPQKRPIGFNR